MLARYGFLAFFLLLVTGASFIATGFSAAEWYYGSVTRPVWTPPAWLIGFAWAFAWLALALSGWQIWLTGHSSRLSALGGWFVLVVLAIAWSALFFGLHRPGWAWLEVSLLLAATAYFVQRFRAIATDAAKPLGAFLVWVLFLWIWTLSTWTLNGGFLSRFL